MPKKACPVRYFMINYPPMDAKGKKSYRLILVALLTGVTIFSVFKYIVIQREKYALLGSLNEIKGEVVRLEQTIDQERELQNALSQENLSLKDEQRASLEKITRLDSDLQNALKTIEELASEVAISQAENTALREEKDKLVFDLSQVSQERDTLMVRLSSVPELKKTIRRVKIEMRKAKLMMKEIAKSRRVVEGNRGYLIMDGKSTFPDTAKIKIEVTPIPPK